MKKIIILLGIVLITGFAYQVKAALFGFGDGQYYDVSGELTVLCFMDKTCYNIKAQQVFADGQGNFTATDPITGSSTPENYIFNPSIKQTVPYIPETFVVNTSTPAINTLPSSPVAGGEPQATVSPISIIADPSFIATSIPASGTQVTLGQWVVTNNTGNDYIGGGRDGHGILASFLSVNFVGKESPNEGFYNIGLLINGGQIGYWGRNFVGSSPFFPFQLGEFAIPANSSMTLILKADTSFSSSTQVTSLTPSLQINQFSGPTMTEPVAGNSLSITH